MAQKRKDQGVWNLNGFPSLAMDNLVDGNRPQEIPVLGGVNRR